MRGGGAPSPGGRPGRHTKVLVLADLGNRAARGVREALAGRTAHRVDVDSLESVFKIAGATLQLDVVGQAVAVELPTLDAFHPDALLANVGPLRQLDDIRRRLAVPATAASAAAELEASLGTPAVPAGPTAAPATPATPPAAESAEALLARLMGRAPAGPGSPSAPASSPASKGETGNVEALIRRLVGPVAAPSLPPGNAGLKAAAELELASRLRAVLHHPGFQRLEASWRCLDLLVRRFPEDARLSLHVLNISLDEIAADLDGFGRVLREHANAMIVLDAVFGSTAEDLVTLRKIATACAAHGARVVAAADPQLVGCDSFGQHADPDDWTIPMPATVQEAWVALRGDAAANARVSLTLPRFLVRLPYGKGGDPIETFGFEEFPSRPPHGELLWGNPAYLRALLRAQAVADASDSPGGEVGELPVHRYRHEGDTVVVPCAEAWLSERAGARISEAGLVPVLSIKGSDSVGIPIA